MAFTTGDNNFGTAKSIVDPTAGQGTHTTISAALTAASSGDDIFIRPGTYTENLTLKAGVNLVGFAGDDDTPNVTIVGKSSLTSAGTVTISNIRLKTNSDFCLSVTGSAASIVNLNSCTIEASNNTAIQFSSSSSSAMVYLSDCSGLIDTTGISYFAHSSAGVLTIDYSHLLNAGSSSTNSTCSAGQLNIRWSGIQFPITCSGASAFSFVGSSLSPAGINTTAFTTSGTSSGQAIDCDFQSGTASAISAGSGTSINLLGVTTVNSANANTITGLGTVSYGAINFTGSSSGVNVSTFTGLPVDIWSATLGTPLTVPNGGTGRSSLTNHGVLVGASTSAITQLSVGTTGQLLVGSTGADPAFGSSASADFTFTTATAAATRTLTISNTDNTSASSNAVLQTTTGGASSGDPFHTFTVTGATSWSHGIDNSASDAYVVSASTALGTSDRMSLTTTGLLSVTSTGAGDGINVNGSASGNANVIQIANSSNTSGSSAALVSVVSGTSGGDAYSQYTIDSATSFCQGIDNSDSDKLKINYAAGSSVDPSGGTNYWTMTAAGAVTMPLQPAFGYYNSSARSNVTGDGTVYTVIFNSASWTQQGSGFDGTSTFTAPVAGVYHFDAAVRLSGAAAQTLLNIQMNHSSLGLFYGMTVGTGAISSVAGSLTLVQALTVFMAASATITVQVVASGSTKTVSVDNTATDTYFSGHLVC